MVCKKKQQKKQKQKTKTIKQKKTKNQNNTKKEKINNKRTYKQKIVADILQLVLKTNKKQMTLKRYLVHIL